MPVIRLANFDPRKRIINAIRFILRNGENIDREQLIQQAVVISGVGRQRVELVLDQLITEGFLNQQ